MDVRLKSADYQPPYPAFTAYQPADRPDVVMALMAVQSRGADRSAIEAQLRQLLEGQVGRPLQVDKSQYVDVQGADHLLFLVYWATREDQAAFWTRPDVAEFVNRPVTGDVGWWFESFHAPTTSLDANYATADIRYGIGHHSELKVEQHHAYMGSMRHRTPDFQEGKSDSTAGPIQRLTASAETLGKTIRISRLPEKLCFIRNGTAWKDAGEEEQAVYRRDMMPVYEEGAKYLRDNPLESNCYSMRITDEVHEEFDNGVQSNALAWFRSLADLETWVRCHPKHLAIMKTIMEYMVKFDFKPKLNLGHEVVVVPAGQLTCVYANCHDETGFLPYFR